jgi:hypothetical protein
MLKRFAFISCILFLFLSFKNDNPIVEFDSYQFPKGYPDTVLYPAITQLKSYPLPRYQTNNNLFKLFNWMNPLYMGGMGVKGISKKKYNNNAVDIQRELAHNWNYGIVIPNSGVAFNSVDSLGNPLFTDLANQNPHIPLHVVTFWMQLSPKKAGFTSKKPMILNKQLDSNLYTNMNLNGKTFKLINFYFPDSLAKIDGETQKFYLTNLLKHLTRPINLINENGEEPPGPYIIKSMKKDPVMNELKNNSGIEKWEDFAASKKLHLRNVYSSSFMKEIPELKNSYFNFYATEGGPIDRFEWSVIKKCMTPMNGIYYSTPDFYPRKPNNWKDWQGPWHGWKWIREGRIKEIKDGDFLFSPFVAAGWSRNSKDDIRPGQWLGLLKSLAVVGAEFYYVGYFSLAPPFINPANWVWQAAMPSYAQAITSRFEDVLKNGNVLFDAKGKPIINYNDGDKHVLVTMRKHNNKDKYIICGTYQPFSNNKTEIPENKIVTINFQNFPLTFEIRRQGSVYVYEKTSDDRIIFYQLDKWHENAHPDHWSHEFQFEAEVPDSTISNQLIYTDVDTKSDYSNFVSYLKLDEGKNTIYNFSPRDTTYKLNYLWIKYRGEANLEFSFKTNSNRTCLSHKFSKTTKWKWEKISFKYFSEINTLNTLRVLCKKGEIDIDKIYITNKTKFE